MKIPIQNKLWMEKVCVYEEKGDVSEIAMILNGKLLTFLEQFHARNIKKLFFLSPPPPPLLKL